MGVKPQASPTNQLQGASKVESTRRGPEPLGRATPEGQRPCSNPARTARSLRAFFLFQLKIWQQASGEQASRPGKKATHKVQMRVRARLAARGQNTTPTEGSALLSTPPSRPGETGRCLVSVKGVSSSDLDAAWPLSQTPGLRGRALPARDESLTSLPTRGKHFALSLLKVWSADRKPACTALGGWPGPQLPGLAHECKADMHFNQTRRGRRGPHKIQDVQWPHSDTQ